MWEGWTISFRHEAEQPSLLAFWLLTELSFEDLLLLTELSFGDFFLLTELSFGGLLVLTELSLLGPFFY